MGKTLSTFDEDGLIPAYGFGDEKTTDKAVFQFQGTGKEDYCNGFEEVLEVYNRITPNVQLSGPTNFVPLIDKAIQICRTKKSVSQFFAIVWASAIWRLLLVSHLGHRC